jgi:hypothetical protein
MRIQLRFLPEEKVLIRLSQNLDKLVRVESRKKAILVINGGNKSDLALLRTVYRLDPREID